MRCVESIRYYGGDLEAAKLGNGETEDDKSALGWNIDSGSVLTASVMLSDVSEYVGGEFQARKDDTQYDFELFKGDLIVWKAMEEHRVTPVTGGDRHVLVVELWDGPANDDERNDGRDDTHPDIVGYCQRLRKADPLNYNIFNSCGANIGERNELTLAAEFLKEGIRLLGSSPKRRDLTLDLAEVFLRRTPRRLQW